MHWIDWAIMLVPFTAVLALAVYTRRYARDVVDYLAAGRVAEGGSHHLVCARAHAARHDHDVDRARRGSREHLEQRDHDAEEGKDGHDPRNQRELVQDQIRREDRLRGEEVYQGFLFFLEQKQFLEEQLLKEQLLKEQQFLLFRRTLPAGG